MNEPARLSRAFEGKTSVLVGVDSSPASAKALMFAVQNLYRENVVLDIVHCYEPLKSYLGAHHNYFPTEKEQDAWRQQQEDTLRTFLQDTLGDRLKDLSMHTCVCAGDPREELLNAAERLNSMILVVGSRGNGAFKRALLGSVSSHLAHHCPRPVVIVHD